MYWAVLERDFQLNHEAAFLSLARTLSTQLHTASSQGWNYCNKLTNTQNFVLMVLPYGVARNFSSFSQDTGLPWEVKLGNFVGRIAHLTGLRPVPSPCNTESGSGELWFTLWDFQAQKFCLELPFDLFIVSNGSLSHTLLRRCRVFFFFHFWEDVVGGSPPGRHCCWVGTQPCSQFQSNSYWHDPPPGALSPKNVGQVKPWWALQRIIQ